MQRVYLTYKYGTKEVCNHDKKELPCFLLEDGCNTTTINSFAYTWDTPENCVVTKVPKLDEKMAKKLPSPLSTDQNENQYFVNSTEPEMVWI